MHVSTGKTETTLEAIPAWIVAALPISVSYICIPVKINTILKSWIAIGFHRIP
jgi:hypothetical protein